jgi:tetratricopeptide (TPR) repeat protein
MLGHQRKAVDIYERVNTIFTNYGLEVEAAKCRLNLANAFADLGKHQEALVIYEEAKDVFVRHGVKSEAQRCDKNTLVTLRELKETGDYSKLH